MTFLKSLARTLLSFLLFLSLSIFGIALMLNLTILNPDFAVSEVDKVDLSSLMKDSLNRQILQDAPYIFEVLDHTFNDLAPWIKKQTHDIIYSSYDYLLEKKQNLNIEISMKPLKDSLKSNLRAAILHLPPPEIAGEPQTEVDRYISEVHQYVDEVIPPTFEFTESSLSPEVLSQLTEIKQAIGYGQITYKVLVALILLLILGLVLIKREIRGATRELGIIFATYGALEYLGIVIFKHLIGAQLSQLSVPPALQAWLPQLIRDSLVPLEIFSLSILVAGIALIIVSFIYKPRQSSPEPQF